MTDNDKAKAVIEAARALRERWRGRLVANAPQEAWGLVKALDALDSPLPSDEELTRLFAINPDGLAAVYAHALRLAAARTRDQHGSASLAAKQFDEWADEMEARE